MEVLGFGRLITPEAQAVMAEGSARHRRFQTWLLTEADVIAVEAPLVSESWQVSGRVDAVVRLNGEPVAIEYKTAGPERFQAMLASGRPLAEHWAQLMCYLATGAYRRGCLVVEERDSGRRLQWAAYPDPAWTAWLGQRLEAVRRYQAAHRLPSREVSRGCLTCDRWQRCFRSEAERAAAVEAHPDWEPDPPLPALPSQPSPPAWVHSARTQEEGGPA